MGQSKVDVPLPGGGTFVYEAHDDDPFVRELFWRGLNSPEGATVAAFYELSRSATHVLDVGAHTGLYTLVAIAAGAGVSAFEPVDRNADALERNLDLNGWQGRCTLRRAAVSATTGRIAMHVPSGEHPMSASLDPKGFRGLSGELVTVQAVALDDLGLDPPPALVKIDVEGFEHLVIEGMRGILETARPVVVVECNIDGPVRAVDQALRDHGYVFQPIRPGAVTMEHLVPDPQELYRNVVCLPVPR